MNKEGIEIMSDMNLQIKELMREVEYLQEQLSVALAERDQADNKVDELRKENNNLQEELEMEKQENELYMEYLDVADAEEAKRKFSKYLSQM